MTDNTETDRRFPLAWPEGWPRTKARQRSPFRNAAFGEARDELLRQLRLANATSVILSTNVRLNQKGLPYAGERAPDDTGVAVYFHRFTIAKGATPIVLACDRWQLVADNMRALGKHVEALRGQERWGVGSLDRAFAGYALPPPSGAPTTPSTPSGPRPWREVLGFASSFSWSSFDRQDALDFLDQRFKRAAKDAHPDAGGSDAAMSDLNVARSAALAEIESWTR